MRIATLFGFTAALTVAAACSSPPHVAAPATPLPAPVLTAQSSGTTALLQAISAVNERVVWVSGHAGTYVRTTDGGATWIAGRVPGADTLQFRDVHATGADTAWLMSAGTGSLSRIFRTTDAGRSWSEQHLNREPEGFFDCMAFWDARRGIVFGDAVRGQHFVLLTSDGGEHWERVSPDGLPAAAPGEGSFAASGTCVATIGRQTAFVGTGNAPNARVLKTVDGGRSWLAYPAPVASGEAAGIASVAVRDSLHGVVIGGEIGKPSARGDYVALTGDGGRTWSTGGRFSCAGPAYGAAYVPKVERPALMAVGPGGADISHDDGRTWSRVDTLAYWSIAFASPASGWAVGPRGRIMHIRVY